MIVTDRGLAHGWRLTHSGPMEMPNEPLNLCGKLLIAMPGMSDPRFEKSVVYMCAHSDEGAMGLIINKPMPEVALADLLKQLSIEGAAQNQDVPVYFGGPVEVGRGFVLHSAEYQLDDNTLKVDEQFAMTATRDVLTDIAGGAGPATQLLALGYAGWGAGQLEGEIQQNGWLTCDATMDVVFNVPSKTKWTAALRLLGVDALTLSATAGRA